MKIHDNLSEYKFERIRRNNLIYDFIHVKMNNKKRKKKNIQSVFEDANRIVVKDWKHKENRNSLFIMHKKQFEWVIVLFVVLNVGIIW